MEKDVKLELSRLREDINQAGAKWRAGATSISALSPQHRKERLGAVPPPHTLSMREREKIAHAKFAAAQGQNLGTVAVYPPSFNLQDVNGSDYVTPIEDQGNCGSCVAFGVTAAVECKDRWQRSDPNLAVDLSEAQLFYCFAEAQDHRTCLTGWWPNYALDAYKNSGIVDAACFPYTAGDQPCKLCNDPNRHVTKITGWHTYTSTDDMKAWLSTNGPLSTCFSVYSDFYYYTSGFYTKTSNATFEGGHCVCVVGYTPQGWICKNSWGPNWGMGGFFEIAYGQCGIDAEMWAVESIV